MKEMLLKILEEVKIEFEWTCGDDDVTHAMESSEDSMFKMFEEKINKVVEGLDVEEQKPYVLPTDSTNNLKYDLERANAYINKSVGFIEKDDLEWGASEIKYYVIPKLENLVRALETEKNNRVTRDRERQEMKEIYDSLNLALKNFDEFTVILQEKHSMAFEDLCELFKGWHLDTEENHFDCYYKNLLVTVKQNSGGMYFLSTNGITVYDENNESIFEDEMLSKLHDKRDSLHNIFNKDS